MQLQCGQWTNRIGECGGQCHITQAFAQPDSRHQGDGYRRDGGGRDTKSPTVDDTYQ